MASDAIEDRIAHDLKAALSPIQASAYVLRRGDALPEATRADMVAVIERQTRRLARMIDEAAEWRRARDGRLVLRPDTVEPELLLELAAGDLPGQPNLHVSGRSAGFSGDQHRLQQMLAALLAVACQRDPGNAPVATLEADGDSLQVAILDRGPPCDPGALLGAPLYDPADQGLGLGVLTAAAIARAHGGDLTAAVPAQGGLRFDCRVRALPPRTG
jgi:K+-sensing histidine kinase KdpD